MRIDGNYADKYNEIIILNFIIKKIKNNRFVKISIMKKLHDFLLYIFI